MQKPRKNAAWDDGTANSPLDAVGNLGIHQLFEVNFRPRTLRANLDKHEAKPTFEAVPNPLPGTLTKLQIPR